MRPHRLELAAFGTYPGHEIVDFDELGHQGLFLIHGPTGAGKSTLLDAISFALYGEHPGDKGRDRLVSQYVKLGTSPFVELEFTVSGGRYRITRTPAHDRPSRRGGVTSRGGTANLDRLDEGRWVSVATKVAEVRAEIEHLIGLNVSQFQQVILLPQGRFERVLQADSDKREELLRTLFDTGMYADMTAWLETRAADAEARVTESFRRLDDLRARADHLWADVESHVDRERIDLVVAQRSESLATSGAPGALFDTDPFERAPVVAAPSVIDPQQHVDRLAADTSDLHVVAQATLVEAEQLLDAALVRLSAAEGVAARWDRRATGRAARQQLLLDAPALDSARDRVAAAQHAGALRPSLDAVDATRAALVAQQSSVAAHQRDLRAAVATAPTLPFEIDALFVPGVPSPEALKIAGDALTAHRAVVDGLVDIAREADRAWAVCTDERRLAARFDDDASLAAAEHARLTVQLDDAVARLDAARIAEQRVADLEQAAAAAVERATAAIGLDAALVTLESVAAARHEAQEASLAARARWSDLRERYLAGIAASLAADLADAEPCPVCGSVDHPAPAGGADDAVDRAEVDAAEVVVERAKSALDDATTRHDAANAEVVRLRAIAGTDPRDLVEATAASATEAATAARALAATVPTLSGTVTEIRVEMAAAAERQQAALTEAAAHHAAADSGRAQAEAAQSKITAVVGDGAEVELVTATNALAGLAHTIDLLRTAADAAAGLDAAHAQAAGRLATDLAASPFEDEASARAALVDPEELETLVERIASFDERLLSVDALLGSPDLADLPDERPDTVAAADEVSTCRRRHTEAVQTATRLATAVAELRQLADEHRSRAAEAAELELTARHTEVVAQRCAGKLPPKISVQRWVLATYLEEICEYANERLGGMSSGRYTLLVDRDPAKHGGKSGLGLRVLDAHTGDSRDVTTLSGGETFQASLALALGVADAVSAHSGGVQLGALFVDEGFGSLDADALQLAMDELDGLRAGGRMVGVISHVGALRERIGYGIEVTKSDQGSTLQVCDVVPV
ncbi:MAG: SMC family ATPase [Acidimicrobiales bacterium]